MRHPTADLGLPLVLDHAAQIPLQQQLRRQLRQAILDNLLPPGTRLPSTRTLALMLGVSRTVTSAAYDELFAEGYLQGRRGSGTYIGSDLTRVPSLRRPASGISPRWLGKSAQIASAEPSPPEAIAFRLGMPSIASLPLRRWHEAWRTVTNCLPPTDYGAPAGDPALRSELALYLGRSRGIKCTAEDIIITAGATHALDLIARATLPVGAAVGLEEPGYPAARRILLAQGSQILPIPVDGDGMQVERLPHGTAAPLLVYTTPSHQYPLATRLAVSRRIALLGWAEANDSLIVEDDYDSEFRFDTSPLPALASLDGTGHVAYIGTFSKVLTPALRVGFLVAPPPLRRSIEQIMYSTNEYASWPVQHMLAAFISNGHLDRHIRRMRQQYAQKRHTLAQTLAPVTSLAQLRGLEAGLHVYLELRSDLNATYIAQLAQQHEVLVTSVDSYYVGPPDRSGLLLGYGGLDIPEIIRGATILREVIEQAGVRTSSARPPDKRLASTV